MKTQVSVNPSPSTTVLINLSGAAGKNGRITVNENTTLGELGVDPKVVEAKKPVFPTSEIASINASSLSGEEKMTRINTVMASYQKASAAFVASSGQTVEDRIVEAVLKLLVTKHGFSRTDVPDKPVIKDDELQVTAVAANNGFLFTVNGTAVWG